ncbi:sialate O-acetylesterase [Stakelama tenebrarum]|uniref:Sialate O-acetylesterase n=1 Tax=Stakelama tenebrarum TaxID=2711215 RepID=A0A6G6Y5H6_9SPHN|nr:sialate O-acetylesterase [Sphingosinithalassobacter tenebrarum]QIG80204.1 sialate O-acetylesterase [Sphingosinithalassobacter tenebrarum]
MTRTALALASSMIALSAVPASAQDLRLDPIFSDNMVLQRGRDFPVSGIAMPGARVTVALDGATPVVTRADANGAWRAMLPAHSAREGATLAVRSGDGMLELTNVAIGDVFLCSGQSNMEFTLSHATNANVSVAQSADPDLRLFNVPRQTSTTPQSEFGAPVAWEVSGPDSTPDFSATCYFMGAHLRETRDVPVGLIAASWGGSIIQDWLSRDGLMSNGGYADGLALLALRGRDPDAAQRQWADQAESYFGRATAELGEPVTADVHNFWEEWGEDLHSYDGTGVYSTRVTLTADQAAHARTIYLGAVDDIDQTLVNGTPVGATIGWNVQRVYDLPADVLHAGENRIELRAIDTGGGGGMWGVAPLRIALDNGETVSLEGEWQFRRGLSTGEAGPAPAVPWIGGNGLTTLYNGMIAPIGRIPLAGISWYQGEANVADAEGYRTLLTSLMADWRARFSTERFAVVQLADFGRMRSGPVESDWAELREAQRSVVDADDAAGLAVAIDIGQPGDIHPTNKQDVGLRLALAMDGANNAALPVATRQGDSVRLTFDRPLQVIGDARPVGFEACAANGCRYVSARMAAGDTVAFDVRPDETRVRYLWADSPITNLYDGDMLPVTPFEMPIPRRR